MSELLIYLYTIINIAVCVWFFRKDQGVFQFPFLIGCVSLTFVAPQLLDLLKYGYFITNDCSFALFHMCLCNLALTVGFNYVSTHEKYSYSIIRFDKGFRFDILIYSFFIIGTVASLMNRGAYKGGFVSGAFVIISFFTSYATIALVLILIGRDRQILNKNVFVFLALIVIALTLDRIMQSGRRAATINLVLTILYFYLNKSDRIYKYLRLGVPAFFIVGMIAGSQIGEYRNNAYAGEKSFIENITSLDFSSESKSTTFSKGEIYNAIEGMNMVDNLEVYDLGANNWNGLIRNFIPSSIISKSTKESLMFNNQTNSLVNHLTRSGSTMTGYFDSYLSFGILGFFKFLIIGYFMGYFWRRRNQSDISLLFYFALLTPGLHLLTHSSNYIISELFFELIFVYPFLKMASSKYESLDDYIEHQLIEIEQQ